MTRRVIEGRRWAGLVGVLALLFLLRGRALMGAGWTNAGMLALRDALLAPIDTAPDAHPVHGAFRGDAAAQAVQHLRRAVPLSGDNPATRWALGRAALAAGDVETAAGVLGALAGSARSNPLLYRDALTALSCAGRHEQVIALHESAPAVAHTPAVSDAVALAYLDLVAGAQGDLGAKGREEVTQWLERARVLRPGDLYANYRLWKQAREGGDAEATAVYAQALTRFYLEAVHPADERLLDYVAQAIPGLLEEGLWDRDRARNVVSFLVWRHSGAAGAERLLERLIGLYPTDPHWLFYLAELHHRRGDLVQAEATYQRVLAVDPAFAQAVLRLGMVAEAKAQAPNPQPREQLGEAARWVGRYHELAPDDPVGLERLAEVCTALGAGGSEGRICRDAAFREVLEARSDERRIVAERLAVTVEDVELGPNLVQNGGFAEGGEGQLAGWTFRAHLGPGGEGLYFADLDLLAGEGSAARIVGLRGGPLDDGTATYGEYRGAELTIPPSDWVVISARYRSCHLDGDGLLFVGEGVEGGVRLTHTYLDASSGQWRDVFILVPGQDREVTVFPLVRNWGLGSVWFDDVRVRPVWLPDMAHPDVDEKGPPYVRSDVERHGLGLGW